MQHESLESAQAEVHLLKSKLGVEQELRAKEMNNSFKIQDEVDEEVTLLKNKISNLESKLHDLVLQCRAAELATNSAISELKTEKETSIKLSELNNSLSDAISHAKSKISVLSDKVLSLESKAEPSGTKFMGR